MERERRSAGRQLLAGLGRVICLFSYVYGAAWLAVPLVAAATHARVPWVWFSVGVGIALAAWYGGRVLVRAGHAG